MVRLIKFYYKESGESPVKDFLDSLPGKVAQKLAWVLSIVEELDIVPAKYFSKSTGTDSVYECRADFAGNAYRLLGFFYANSLFVLTNGFMKKTRKTPKEEIELAESRRKDFLLRGDSK